MRLLIFLCTSVAWSQSLVGIVGSVSHGGAGGISIVITSSATGAPSGVTVPSSSSVDTTGANKIVFGVATSSAAGSISMTDSKGNTYVLLSTFPYTVPGDVQVRMYCADVSTGAFTVGSGHTFTFSGTASFASAGMIAFGGTDNTSCGDQQNGTFINSSVTAISTGNITPTTAGSAWVSVASATGSAIGNTATATFGTSTGLMLAGVSGTAYPIWMSYKLNAGTSAQQETWAWASAGATAAGIVSFK